MTRANTTRRALPIFALVFCGVAAYAGPTYTTVPFAGNSDFTSDITINGNTFPTGSQTFNGVPFSIPTSGPNYYNSYYTSGGAGYGLTTLTIPVNVYGVTDANTLINTYYGYPGSASTSVVFTGTGGATFTKILVGGTDIRDYNQAVYQNTTLAPTTTEVFNNGLGQRFDEQDIMLPGIFSTQTLTSIAFNDTGGDPALGFQRAFLAGLTVASNPVSDGPPPTPTPGASTPEPNPAGAVGLGALGLLMLVLGKRRRVRAF